MEEHLQKVAYRMSRGGWQEVWCCLLGLNISKLVMSSPVGAELAREGDVHPLVLLQLLLIVVAH